MATKATTTSSSEDEDSSDYDISNSASGYNLGNRFPPATSVIPYRCRTFSSDRKMMYFEILLRRRNWRWTLGLEHLALLRQMESSLHAAANEIARPSKASGSCCTPDNQLHQVIEELKLLEHVVDTFGAKPRYSSREDTVVFGGLSSDYEFIFDHPPRNVCETWMALANTRETFLQGRQRPGAYLSNIAAVYFCVQIGLWYLCPLARNFNKKECNHRPLYFLSSQQRELVRSLSIKLEAGYVEFLKRYWPYPYPYGPTPDSS